MRIAIAGNIGAGKTSLTKQLSKSLKYKAYYEDVIANPYLDDFYERMERWSFNLQIYFLNSRFNQMINCSNKEKDTIQDRTIYEDAFIFAPNLHAMGLMSSRDFDNYKEIFDFGLPLLESTKQKTSQEIATEILYINYLSNSLDSHLKRKFGKEKAQIVMKKAQNLKKKIKILKNNRILLKDLDHYLKKFHLNPGTCADLTVTTLLIDKIRDIFKFSL